jgi:hypothetical protein
VQSLKLSFAIVLSLVKIKAQLRAFISANIKPHQLTSKIITPAYRYKVAFPVKLAIFLKDDYEKAATSYINLKTDEYETLYAEWTFDIEEDEQGEIVEEQEENEDEEEVVDVEAEDEEVVPQKQQPTSVKTTSIAKGKLPAIALSPESKPISHSPTKTKACAPTSAKRKSPRMKIMKVQVAS